MNLKNYSTLLLVLLVFWSSTRNEEILYPYNYKNMLKSIAMNII